MSILSVEEVRFGIYFGVGFGILIILSICGLIIRYFHPRIFKKDIRKKLETSSNRFRYKYNSSPISAAEEIFVAVFCFTSFIIFIYLTTQVTKYQGLPNENILYRQLFRKSWLICIEVILSWIFLLDYILHLYMSGNRFRFLWSFPSMVTILSILPAMYAMFSGYYFYGFQHLRVIRTYQSLQFLQYYKKTQKLFDVEKGFAGQVILLVFTIWALILAAAGFEFVVENQTINPNGLIHGFFNSIYFTIITMSTVGYGDIVPRTVFGKLVIIGLVLLSIILVPFRAAQLVDIIRTTRDKSRKKFHGHPHVVLVCHDPSVISAFLEEFYHEDRQETRMKICVLVSAGVQIPTTVLRLLQTPPNNLRSDLLQGNPLVDYDLERSKMKTAKACFILSDKFTGNWRAEDAKILLEIYAIQHYAENVPIHAQVIEQQKSLESLAPQITPISLLNLKLAILAQSLICPGFITFIGGLVKVYKPSHEVINSRNRDWRSEYLYGLGNELYVSNALGNFAGISFFDAVNIIFKETEALCIGILVHNGNQPEIILNPGSNYIIKREDKVVVIAQDMSVVDRITLLETELLEIQSRVFVCQPSKRKKGNLLDQPMQEDKRLLESSIVENANGILKGHFILVSQQFELTFKLVNFLRRFNSEDSILILTEVFPTAEEWDMIIDCSKVFIMKIEHQDTKLEKAALKDSRSVAILRQNLHAHDPVVDASNIILFRSISQIQDWTIIDLVHSSNARYLGVRAKSQITTTENVFENSYFAAGQIYIAAIGSYFSVSNYFNPGLQKLLQELLSGCVVAIAVNRHFQHFVGRKYSDFIAELGRRGCIPIALFRESEEGRYCVTNPWSSITLRIDDIALILDSC